MNSIGTLYIDTPAQEKQGAFNVEREISEDEYVRMLRDYSATIGTGMPGNSITNRYGVYNINNKTEQADEHYSKATAKIYDISGKPCGVREIDRIIKTGMGVLIIEIDEHDLDDTFESEFKFWKRDSMNINNDTQIDKDERIRFLPTKDLKFEIDYHMYMFIGCKIYCEYEKMKVALIIQKITEI